MEETLVPSTNALSEPERLVDAFIAPTKTFTDIFRSSSWWLPFVFMVLVGFLFSYSIDKKVGFDSIAQHEIEKNKFAAERIDSLPADQRAAQYSAAATRTKYTTYGYSVIILIWAAIISFLYWASMNFGLGAQLKYKQVFAIWMYASLPNAIKALLSSVLLFANVGTDNFDVRNPIGTNPGYYLPDAGAGLRAALSFIDVFSLWSLALMVLGLAIVSRKTKGQTAIVVVGWWVLGLLISAGMAAAFS